MTCDTCYHIHFKVKNYLPLMNGWNSSQLRTQRIPRSRMTIGKRTNERKIKLKATHSKTKDFKKVGTRPALHMYPCIGNSGLLVPLLQPECTPKVFLKNMYSELHTISC